MSRLGLTALAVESPRLVGRGVAARIFWLVGQFDDFAHDADRIAWDCSKSNRREPQGLTLTSSQEAPSS